MTACVEYLESTSAAVVIAGGVVSFGGAATHQVGLTDVADVEDLILGVHEVNTADLPLHKL